MPSRFFASILCLSCCFIWAQEPGIEALKTSLKKQMPDTERCFVLSQLAEIAPDGEWENYNEQLKTLAENNLAKRPNPVLTNIFTKYLAGAINNKGYLCQMKGDIPKALFYYRSALTLNQKLENKKGIAAGMNNIGTIYASQGNLSKALDSFEKALKAEKEEADKEGIAQCLNNIASIYSNQGNVVKALEYYTQSLHNREEVKDQQGIAVSLLNIGANYDNQGETRKALEYFNRALLITRALGNKLGEAQCLNNIGFSYMTLKDLPKALFYFRSSLEVRKRIGDNPGMGESYTHIGSVYVRQKELEKALEYFFKSLAIREEIRDKQSIAKNLVNIGSVYVQQQKYDLALEYCNRALQMSKELGYPENISVAAKELKTIYQAKNNYSKALEMYELFIQMRDSIANEQTKKATLKAQFRYEYEKKAAADSIKATEDKKVIQSKLMAQQAQIKQEQTQRFALYGGLALVLTFSGFLFNRFRVTQKQKNTIELQKAEVEKQKHITEEKNKEIVDSINYAKRLQDAILPPERFWKEQLPDSFVLYKPKDIVAGDFYWMEVLDGRIFIAAADCTGHGVPGAMVSVVCSNALNRAVKEFGISEPGKILDKVRELVIETFEKSESEVKDGMDISLAALTQKAGKTAIRWAGANNPLWYIKNGQLHEIKADKQPIGKYADQKPFTTHTLDAGQADSIYIFTDGYADQFGGPKGKKLKYKQLEEILVRNFQLDTRGLAEVLNREFENWKGQLEQVDDVCIIGVKL